LPFARLLCWDETHISAEKEETSKNARVSQTICQHERAGASQTPAQKGPRTAFRISVLLMPRKNTLTHAEFVRADMARFRRERGSIFILSFGTLPGQKPTDLKATCVVSKKTAARAVDRNLIKRRWRAAMSQCLSAAAPSALVFYAMKPANGASFEDIKSDVQALVERAGAKLRSS
jgi:ribonuclease P protein component